MKIVSFLGFNSYQETTYVSSCKQKQCRTPFFQEALVEFYQPEVLYVLLTKTVENEIPKGAAQPNWLALKERLQGKVDIQPISNIPETNSPEDIWMIFQEVTNLLDPDDRVIFDITHSFRSVPIVALLAVSYLRIVRDVKIEGLLYGAFEAKNKETDETPTFDLLPIVSLLDWTTATDQFIKTGDAGTLADLLQSNNSQTAKLSQNIQDIAQGLRLLRPMDVMRESAHLAEYIQEATPVISKSIPPFSTLSDRIVKDYGNFGLAEPENYSENSKTALLKQLQMIEWYAEKQQIVQALSLAREWLPSLLCYHFDLDPQVKSHRDEMDTLLNGGKSSKYLEEWNKLEQSKTTKLKSLCCGDKLNLQNLRNDALHAGFRKNPRSASDMIEQTHQIISELKQVAIDWNLLDKF
jgi:CRISPR-associated Csx2 family protein